MGVVEAECFGSPWEGAEGVFRGPLSQLMAVEAEEEGLAQEPVEWWP